MKPVTKCIPTTDDQFLMKGRFEKTNEHVKQNKQTNKQQTNKQEQKHAIALNYILLFLLSYPVAHKG